MNKSFLISNKINVLIATMKKLDEIEALMGNAPDWLSDINLRADGYECLFYQKD